VKPKHTTSKTSKPRSARGPRAADRSPKAPRPLSSGLAARQLAVVLISAVMSERRSLDEALAISQSSRAFAEVDARDRAFARLIAATVLRRHGELSTVLQSFLDKPLPERRGRLTPILLAGAAQLLLLGTPAHAAISLAVDQCRLDRDAQRFDKLTNAVLRRVAEKGTAVLAGLDAPALNVPNWLMRRWRAAYGAELAQQIATASLREAPLDVSLKVAGAGDALGGLLLPTGSMRLGVHGRIEDLPGYGDGSWWVQDAAAALPARLLGDVAGLDVADLCAAPGGKTAELASAGAWVTAVDASKTRLQRVRDNLDRLKLDADIVHADATTWSPGKTFDAVLLDAPCTATGTIRRHPDILHLKREGDVAVLADLQARLLAHAATLVKAGGTLVYCTCSLEAEEGREQVSKFLDSHRAFARKPVAAGEAGIAEDWITADGELRTLPTHLALETPELSGMDGFYAARLRRSG
jgi:16S rRNA (cytosine967-C5)-methyltransferase